MKIWQFFFIGLLIIGSIYVITREQAPYQSNKGMIFGTLYNITYQSNEDLKTEIENELQQVDNALSPFNKTSIISKINRNEDTIPNKMFLDVFNLSQKISEHTDGAFDITVAQLVNLWGFGFKKAGTVTSQAIDSLRQYTGYKNIKIEGDRIIKKHPETMLDCSAIAKGYGCDAVAKLFKSKGIKNYMVEIGGEIATSGFNPKNGKWVIGISQPIEDSLAMNTQNQTILHITDMSMATSGDYRNYYYKDGKKYAHTINPHTGYPIEHTLLSATVIAKDCATADAYATAFMVMGLEKAIELCKNNNELDAYFIYSGINGEYLTQSSDGMKKHQSR